MTGKNNLEQCIWSAHDRFFLKGLSELLLDIDDLIHIPIEKVYENFFFINLSTISLNFFIRNGGEWIKKEKKHIVLIAENHSEALANYWYFNNSIRGIVYTGLTNDIRQELAYVINGRFLRKDIKKGKITNREMQIVRMTVQGMHAKSIAKTVNCSVKTVYNHRRNAEEKLCSDIYRLAF